MNLESYDVDSIRKLVRGLEKENRELKKLLDQAKIPYARSDVFQREIPENNSERTEEYDLDQGARIIRSYIDQKRATQFFSMFWGREDVFARRAKNGQYYPQCENRWESVCPRQNGKKQDCGNCEQKKWTKLTPEILVRHLLGYREDGTDVIGVYPLLPDGTCRLLVFDFDNHAKGAEKEDFANEDEEWREEVDALRMICVRSGVDALVERSRSGRGAHIWIFFRRPVTAAAARNFGFLLLDKGAAEINLRSFRYYDRMFPTQDSTGSIGNLVALPLQGQALKQGNSAFVDENWNAYPDQWERLFSIRKLTEDDVKQLSEKWQGERFPHSQIYDSQKNRLRPWNRKEEFEPADVTGKLHITLADGVYVDALNLNVRLQNQIRYMAVFDNPVYYKNMRTGRSNYYNSSTVYLGADADGYIRIPRGLLEELEGRCRKAGISYDIADEREKGRPIRVSFSGELRMQQDLAAQCLLGYDNGILSAATAFGKTVVCSYLIAERKVNTLILLESTDLLAQWEEELKKFLIIDEEPPEYQTKTGRTKRRESVIGILKAGKDTLTGIIDVAMIGSLYRKGNFHERLNSYGMVIMDECHHAASSTAQEILKKVNAKYVYGVSATPMRSDNLEKINFMLLGPVRHRYTALERNTAQGIDHLVIPRFTRAAFRANNRNDINEAYEFISKNEKRNEQIAEDLRICISQGRTPVVLTRYKEQARMIYERVQNDADHVFLLYGDNSAKENEAVRAQLKKIADGQTVILVATGQKIGEGFDFPRLDTLMLAAPVSYGGRLEQYVGRLSRDYEGKKSVVVYDYIDSYIWQFESMYRKRLHTYKKIGFCVTDNVIGEKQDVNAIYDSENYMPVFERDLIEAEKEIVISSPHLTQEKTGRLVRLMKPRQESGVKVTVITQRPEESLYESAEFVYSLIQHMEEAGIRINTMGDEPLCYAVIDRKLVWHGGMNLLGKADVWDNLIRVRDRDVAEELLDFACQSCEQTGGSIGKPRICYSK